MKKGIQFILIFLLTLTICACETVLSDKTLPELFEKNGYTESAYEECTIAASLDLRGDIEDFPEKGKNELVLVKYRRYYGFAVVNAPAEKLVIPELGYIPLNVVMLEIWNNGNKEANVQAMTVFKKYLENYGVNCLTEKKYAEAYLREITGAGGVIQTAQAQSIISNSTMRIFPEIDSPDEVTVLFEDGNAVPMYYATPSSTMVYNWNHIFDESVYKVWEASTEYQTQQIMIALNGPPYSLKEVWAVVDSDLQKVGTFNSLDNVKRTTNKEKAQLTTSETPKPTPSPSPSPSPTPKPEKPNPSAAYMDILKSNIFFMKATILHEGVEKEFSLSANGSSTAMETIFDGMRYSLIEQDGIAYLIDHQSETVTASTFEVAPSASNMAGDRLSANGFLFSKSGRENWYGESLPFDEYKTATGSTMRFYFRGTTLAGIETTDADGTVAYKIQELSAGHRSAMHKIPESYTLLDMAAVGG